MARKIFISHADKDKDLVDAFVDLLKILEIRDDEIFCSSIDGLGIPNGLDFVEYIKKEITTTPLAIVAILSRNYYSSSFCLCELGAAWALTQRIFPLLLDPLGYDDIKGVLTRTQLTRISEKQALLDMIDNLVTYLGIDHPKLPRIDAKVNQFITKIPSLISTCHFDENVTISEVKELRKFKDETLATIEEYENEITQLKTYIKGLENLKDKIDVSELKKELSTEREKYESIVDELRGIICKNPSIVNYALFKSLSGEDINSSMASDRQVFYREAKDAAENGFLIDDTEISGNFILNSNDCSIKKSIDAMELFEGEVSVLSQEFIDELTTEIGFSPSIQIKRYWTSILRCSFLF